MARLYPVSHRTARLCARFSGPRPPAAAGMLACTPPANVLHLSGESPVFTDKLFKMSSLSVKRTLFTDKVEENVWILPEASGIADADWSFSAFASVSVMRKHTSLGILWKILRIARLAERKEILIFTDVKPLPWGFRNEKM